MRSAMQQRDSLSVVIKYSEVVDLVTDQDSSDTAGIYRNIYQVLKTSPMFSAFQDMYDQVKVDGAQVSVTQRTSNNTYQSVNNPLSLVTAWDRSGLSATTSSTSPTGVVSQNLSYDNVTQYSSAAVKAALFGTFYRTTRTIYPSTLQEKSQWVSTGSLSLTSVPTATNLGYDSPVTPTESGTFKWKPTFLFVAQSVAQAPTAGTSFGTFYLEYSIPVTFRGLRKLGA